MNLSKHSLDPMIKRFYQQGSHKFLALFSLFVCSINHSVQCHFEHMRERVVDECPPVDQVCSDHHREAGECPADLMSFGLSARARAFFRYFRHFHRILMICVSLTLLRRILPLDWLVENLLRSSQPVYCYLPGRQLHFPHLMESGLAVLSASISLTWRYMRLVRQKQLHLDLFGFLMFNGDEVERESSDIEHQLVERRMSCKSCSDLRAKQLSLIMRLPVEVGRRSTNTLIRPNRTPDAHRQLCRELILTLGPSLCSFLLVLIVGIYLTMCSIMSDLKYLERYPGCDPKLEMLKGDLQPSDWLVRTSWHRLFSILFDLIDNLFWMDLIIGAFLFLPVFHLLNEDLLIYCRYITAHLRQLEQKSSAANKGRFRTAYDESNKQSFGGQHQSVSEGPFIHQEWLFQNRVSLVGDDRVGGRRLERRHLRGVEQARQLEHLVADGRLLIRCFFSQLDAVDELVSDYLTLFAIFWQVAFVFQIYYSSSTGQGVNFAFRVLQLDLFVGFSIISTLLLRLHREAVRSYPTIFSILASYQTFDNAKFLEVQDFFVGRKRATYTIFDHKPFTRTTFMTIVSWTLSILTVLEKLLQH